jgi:hypothetical protein
MVVEMTQHTIPEPFGRLRTGRLSGFKEAVQQGNGLRETTSRTHPHIVVLDAQRRVMYQTQIGI